MTPSKAICDVYLTSLSVPQLEALLSDAIRDSKDATRGAERMDEAAAAAALTAMHLSERIKANN